MANKVATGIGVAAVIGGIILLGAKAKAEPEGPPRYATLYGTVSDVDTGEPIEFASVSLNGRKTITDASGMYVFEDIKIWETQRTFTLTVKKSGYQTFQRIVTLAPDFNTFNLELTQ